VIRKQDALDYHSQGRKGKIEVAWTKPCATQRDLSLAYTPGVADPCRVIHVDPAAAYEYTAKGNLVAVVSNGTAVLGLGDIGPLAGKPVMEGKAVLFKRFADIDVFDIELDTKDPEEIIRIVRALGPTFGGINLEDIKAPECFEIERRLRERLKIPVFHDDQHGTAIIVAAAIRNGLKVVGKDLKQVKLVTSGAGAAALACLDLLVSLGLPIENIIATDIAGVVYQGRKAEMDPNKARYAKDTKARKLAEVIAGADVFLGLSAPGVLKPEMVRTMAEKPLILALANPTPEIMPEQAREARPDAIIASGRSDYPNQVNNVLCFPFIFRGALDVGATVINEAMKIACVEAIAALAHAEASDIVAAAYGGQSLSFGPEYLIPRPFDPRLIVQIAPAVAKAAMDSGVATRPIEDLDAYRDRLSQFVFRSGLLMKPIFDAARTDPRRLVFAEGEDERVLRAAQQLVDDGLAKPVLVGRLLVVMQRLDRLGLRIKPGRDFELVDPEGDPRFPEYWRLYHSMMERKGVSPDLARNIVRTRNTVIGALMIRRGEAEAMICGTVGRYDLHLEAIGDVIGLRRGVRQFYALNAIILPHGTFFICDTQVMADPTAEQLVDMTLLAVEVVQRFGLSPKVAMLSHSSFGTGATISARKMQAALRLLRAHAPDLEVEGEMQADLAFDEETRLKLFPGSLLKGQANLLIMPTLDAANIALNLFRGVGDGLSVGPILVGAARPAHILTPTARVRGIVNMSALAVVEAQAAAPAGT